MSTTTHKTLLLVDLVESQTRDDLVFVSIGGVEWPYNKTSVEKAEVQTPFGTVIQMVEPDTDNPDNPDETKVLPAVQP